jgi:hypothetical protein
VKNRSLTLRADRLGDLSTEELADVVGAFPARTILDCIAITQLCPTWDCTGCYLTCGC